MNNLLCVETYVHQKDRNKQLKKTKKAPIRRITSMVGTRNRIIIVSPFDDLSCQIDIQTSSWSGLIRPHWYYYTDNKNVFYEDVDV